ncbi:hypothetical protein MTR67_043855 [Solanum verrucosum]|uniref:DUF4218 domain-containing protein n=1 Tax=Solanum verrucosum TaxID=315347 RepID=A0AAF0UPT8_SOLVR|nr:hypothetical protein MTR67_043855 [Solanum verrucosum]
MTEISLFFKDLCSNTLREDNLVQMDQNIPIITNKLEKILPPGFFDVMEHLPVHLVHEARLGGPVQYRWMYPFEREITDFGSYYFESSVPCFKNRSNHHDDGGETMKPLSIFNQPGKGSKKRTRRNLSAMEFKSVSTHVLLNCPQVKPFLDYFVHLYGNEKVFEHFSKWFQDYNAPNIKKTNNSGVWMKGGDGNQDGVDYYGVLKEVLEMEYSGWPIKKIVLFRCKWFDPTPKRGTREIKQYNIIEVKHTREYEAYDPFIIAQNVKQVYYAPYPLRPDKLDWWVVIKTKPMGRVEVENVLDVAYQDDDISSVYHTVDVELENDLEHPEHILEEVDIEQITDEGANASINEEELFNEEEWSEEEDEEEDDDEDEDEDEDE